MQHPLGRPASAPGRGSLGLLVSLIGAAYILHDGRPVRAGEIRASGGSQSLGTLVNGGATCTVGACAVTGGTPAGGNLFHRFSAFDTRGSITGVSIQNAGFGAVIVGVTSPLGSFIDKPVALSSPGQLYWLSPGGIALSGGASFPNALQLNLSTATGLRIGSAQFDVGRTTALQASALRRLPGAFVTEADTIGAFGLLSNGDLSIDGGLLTVEQALLLDAQGGHLLLDGSRLKVPGGEIALAGASASLNNALVDVSASSGPAGRVLVASRATTLLGGTTQLRAEGERGGAIDLLGRTVVLADQTMVQASGEQGGGSIRIGGDYLGGNPEVANAWQTLVGPEVQVLANATVNGDGGRVIVWADDTTRMLGTLQARGGPAGGNGGFIETSGKRILSLGAIPPDASAPEGDPGTWLLDPGSITIGLDPSGASVDLPSNPYENATGDPIFINPSGIESALNAGTNVTLIAGTDLTVDASISVVSSGAPVTLSLGAGDSVVVNQSIGSTGRPLNVFLDAGFNVDILASVTTNGGQFAARAGDRIFSSFGGPINALGGQVLLQANNDVIVTDLTAGRVTALSGSGNIDLSMNTPPGSEGVEVGPILLDQFFGSSLFGTGIDASRGRFDLSVDGGGGSLLFVGTNSSPFTRLAGGVVCPDGCVGSQLSAQTVFVSGVELTIGDQPSPSGEPLLVNADVQVSPGASLVIANDGVGSGLSSQVRFQGNILNQGLLSIESGASIALRASPNALTLASGSTLSGSGSLRGVPNPLGGFPLTRIVQESQAIVSPGDGDGRRSLGALTFENILLSPDAGAIWRFDLGSGSTGAVDSIVFPAPSVLGFSESGVPQVVIGLENPSSPPPLGQFTLIPSPFVASASALDELNALLVLTDGVQGVLRSGSLLFDYQPQSSGGGGGGGGPVPPGPVPPGPVPPGPIPPGPVPPDPTPPRPSPSRPELTFEQLLLAVGAFETPIIPGYDVKPRPSFLPEIYNDALGVLTINIRESFMGAILSDAAVALSNNLNQSISPAGGVPLLPPSAPSEPLGEDSMVISVDDSSGTQTMEAFRNAEVRRVADVNSKLSVMEPPVTAPVDLSMPTLRDGLDRAAQSVKAGAGGAGL